MRDVTTKTLRPLQIRFDAYGAGDDNEFKYELIVLMTGSIKELKIAAQNAFGYGGPDGLKRAIHKSKSTLTLINDQELFEVVDNLWIALANPNEKEIHRREALGRFNSISDSIVESLQRESAALKEQFD